MATVPTPEMKGWFAEREDEKLWPGTSQRVASAFAVAKRLRRRNERRPFFHRDLH